ncbi:MAG: helix-hairpin-helix domain-containing protein [Blastocatellia bacterium]|nr:helix-hairpin-helix domain-containing protein [Blastocatellia bacterium]
MTGKPFASALISLSLVSLACTSRIVYEAAAEPATVGTVNINTASVAELEMLPGVGQKTAESIVEHREQHGTFRRVEHLMLVQGVSESRFVEIRPLITH